MRNFHFKLFTSLLCTTMLLTSCTFRNEPHVAQIESSKSIEASIKVDNQTTFPHVPVIKEGKRLWIPLEETSESLDYIHSWDPSTQTFSIGQVDSVYSIRMDKPVAKVEEQNVTLPNAPKVINGKPYISLESLSRLWSIPVTWDDQQKSIQLHPLQDVRDDEIDHISTFEDSTFSVESLHKKNINEKAMITYAKNYMGVPYLFGTGPYKRTHHFDCSSFTRHVFKKFHIHLPRTARSQARLGKRVSVHSLRRGDLLFFYVPGRFKTNRTVGHVGIYTKNGHFIHTFGAPGVTISSLNDPFWKKTFLFAKRVTK